VLAFLENFIPKKGCLAYATDLRGEPGMSKLDFIIQQVECGSTLDQIKTLTISQDEILAIGLYTWDLKFNGREDENFYYVLNRMLRERNSTSIRKWAGFIHYFQSALSKLPDFKITVYRGVRNRNFVEENYKLGRKIHWSAYSSTSLDAETAKEFATVSGIVLSIKVVNGKSIKDYSPFQEGEILLSPNMSFIVSKELYDANGWATIKLVQVSTDKTFVF